MKIRPRFQKKARLEMTPLLDAIFLLLIFFLYMVLQMRFDKGISVNLSEVSASEIVSQKDDNYIVVGITKNGDIYFNKEKVSLDELYSRLKLQKKDKDKQMAVCIRGDNKSYHSQTVAVLDVLLKAQINRVFFEVTDDKSSSNNNTT